MTNKNKSEWDALISEAANIAAVLEDPTDNSKFQEPYIYGGFKAGAKFVTDNLSKVPKVRRLTKKVEKLVSVITSSESEVDDIFDSARELKSALEAFNRGGK